MQESSLIKKLGNELKQLRKSLMIFGYVSLVAANIAGHGIDGVNASNESKRYSSICHERWILARKSGDSFNEIVKPYILIPGSYFWRKVEKPNFEERPYKIDEPPIKV